MQNESYPFPIDEWPAADASGEERVAYEQTLLLLLFEWIKRQGGKAHGQSGVLLAVRLEGKRPETHLVLRYRSHAGGEYDARWPIWDEESLDSPAQVVSDIVSSWDDGSIRADRDPYWAAVERQRHAVAQWRATFPDAAAAMPTGITDHAEAVAASRRWTERFPDASASWAQIGPVKAYLD